MRGKRYDKAGRLLHNGESQRSQDGRYVYTYMNPWKKRCYVYARSLAELRKKEDELKRNQLDRISEYKEGIATLNDLVDRYLALKTGLALSTWSNYKYMYDRFCRGTLGKCKLSEIRYSDLKYFFQKLIEQGIKIKSLETIHCILHPAFEMAVRDDVIRKNPSDKIISELKKSNAKNKREKVALTLAQQTKFMDYISESPIYKHWVALFTLLLYTGARIGEICGLRWQDVDFKKRVIRIDHSMTYFKRWNGSGYECGFKCGFTKTEAGVREIPMLTEVYDVLQEEYNRQKEEGFNTLVVDEVTGFIFVNKEGKLHRHSSLDHSLKRIIRNYNVAEMESSKREWREPIFLPNFSCHNFRHTFCTRLCEHDVNLKVIQNIMGHRDINTTMDIYTHTSAQKNRESIEKFDKMINNSIKEIERSIDSLDT